MIEKYKQLFKLALIILIAVVFSLLLSVILPFKLKPKKDAILGVTYSISAAEYLNLDAQTVFSDIINQLSPKIVRIPIEWSRVEQERGSYIWDDYDQLLSTLQKSNTNVIFVTGLKVPRWPECYLPTWTQNLSEDEVKESLENFIQETVTRYQHEEHLSAWQVENELFFDFGDCPNWINNRAQLKSELELVRRLDPKHKIYTTDSGELSLWIKASTLPIDALGVSLYRSVYNESTIWLNRISSRFKSDNYFHWPINPLFYHLHAVLMKPWVSEVFISELQMEPWGPVPVDKLSNKQILDSFAPDEFEQRVEFARATRAKTILLWGVEWWYYMDMTQKNPVYWQKARKLFSNPLQSQSARRQ